MFEFLFQLVTVTAGIEIKQICFAEKYIYNSTTSKFF